MRLAATVLALTVGCLAWPTPATAAATETAKPDGDGKIMWFRGAHRAFALCMGLTRGETREFLLDSKKVVVPVAGGLVFIGLICCFFGWRLLKFGIALVGAIFGIWVGALVTFFLVLLAAALLSPLVPKEYSDWVAAGLFLFVGTPVCTVGARAGRSFAMFGARTHALGRVSLGRLAVSLLRFAFFDISIIFGYALFGAMLITVGAYCAAVPLLNLPVARLRSALSISGAAALAIALLGAAAQMSARRSKPPEYGPGAG